ncbi:MULTISPECIES: ABC exporter membrane fusion protein [Nostocales]|uniref:Biotin/lipoyl-binding protein n=1 Tax=Dolichospermum flos-aquae UHCC 0037 TaxID=2590026 RepID=A0ACC7S902_DOLFA|nr:MULTISPECIES: ABC exporter membrane fusion protein [Nostocales]MBO1067342.1 ABC exporter membrane fusion protein [Anabaena sp. 54]MTJ44990.1 biotin/lipoyl-binding protein [Dolichospermum flos-aquae UHCC 0037]
MKLKILTQSKKRWSLGLTIILLTAISMGIVYRFMLLKTKGKLDISYSTLATSDSAKVPPSVSALGILEPQGEVVSLSAPAFAEGARVEKLLVKEGDNVETGQVIATLDSLPRLAAAVQKAEAQVLVAEAKLRQIQTGAKQGEIKAQKATIKNLQAELEGQILAQEATIERLKAQLKGEKEAKQAEIERLRAEMDNAKTECRRYQVLYQDGAVTTSQRDIICLADKTAVKRVIEAEINLTEIMLTRQEQINEAQANLKRTKITLAEKQTEAKATLEKIEEIRPVDISLAEAELKSAEASLKQARAELDLSYVKSPLIGQVLKIRTRPGELISNKGIVELGRTKQMYVNTEVYETDIHRVKLGQEATIISQGFPGKLKGTVAEIGLAIGKKDILGTDPVADIDARVVEVKIHLDSNSSQQVANLTNLQVKVLINTFKKTPQNDF